MKKTILTLSTSILLLTACGSNNMDTNTYINNDSLPVEAQLGEDEGIVQYEQIEENRLIRESTEIVTEETNTTEESTEIVTEETNTTEESTEIVTEETNTTEESTEIVTEETNTTVIVEDTNTTEETNTTVIVEDTNTTEETNTTVIVEDTNTTEETNTTVIVEDTNTTEETNTTVIVEDTNTTEETNTTVIVEDTTPHLQLLGEYKFPIYGSPRRLSDFIKRDTSKLTKGFETLGNEQWNRMQIVYKVYDYYRINTPTYLADTAQYGKSDYWTVLSKANNFTGDCEDYAFAIMEFLIESGVDPKDIKFQIGEYYYKEGGPPAGHAWLEVESNEGAVIINYRDITRNELWLKRQRKELKVYRSIMYIP